jgi:hypothetical protein
VGDSQRVGYEYLEISVHNTSIVHVLEAEDDFGRVELHVVFGEHAVCGEMVVEITAIHEIKYEAEFVGCLERVRHAHDEWTVVLHACGERALCNHAYPRAD